MSRSLILSLLMFVAVPGGVAAQTLTLKSDAIDPPDRETMFSGPGSEVVNDNCLACHSAGMILTQPPLSAATWNAETEKMIHVYKASVDERDVAAIVDYLTKMKNDK